jgi:iron complex transport system ATP-binding protein
MIEVRSLSAGTASGKELLSLIDLKLGSGKILGLYGPNGSGKSTFLRAVAGVSHGRILRGEVEINGTVIDAGLGPRERVKRVIYLGSDFETPFELKVRELFDLGAQVMNRNHGEVTEVVEHLHLVPFLDRDFKSLSDGEKQFMMFARALIQRPHVIIFDESFSKLDLDKLLLVAKVLREFSAGGLTAIVASHDLNFLSEFADEFLFLKKGARLASGSAADVFSRNTLEHLYPDVPLQIVKSSDTGRMKILY